MAERAGFTVNTLRAIALVLLAGKLALLVFVHPFMDEAYYAMWGQHPALSYFDHPPLIGWTQGLSAAIFGWNQLGLRVPLVLTLAADVALLNLFARRLGGDDWQRMFWLTLALFCSSPVFSALTAIGLPDHLLIVTREFEPQQALLDASDFDALFACLAQIDGLGFYNSGPEAGASQPHKHLQIVPLPLGQPGPALPIEPLLAAARFGTVPGLPFAHEFARLNSTPENALEQYHTLLRPFQPMPYNLLCTRDWMLLVPRSVSQVEDIAVNALGFAGSLFVRDEAQMRNVERLGPMNVLRRAGIAPSR